MQAEFERAGRAESEYSRAETGAGAETGTAGGVIGRWKLRRVWIWVQELKIWTERVVRTVKVGEIEGIEECHARLNTETLANFEIPARTQVKRLQP